MFRLLRATPRDDASFAEWAVPAVFDAALEARSHAWLKKTDDMRALANGDAFQEHIAELARVTASHDIGVC